VDWRWRRPLNAADPARREALLWVHVRKQTVSHHDSLMAQPNMASSSRSFVITVLAGAIGTAAVALLPGCGNSVNALSNDGAAASSSGGSGGGGTSGGGISGGGISGGGTGGGVIPIGQAQCSDGIDNDGDGKIDYADQECVGPLDDDEGTFATGIPGDNSDPCRQDCFFDGDSGMGNDGCLWQLKCDPMSTNASCPYDAAYAQSHTMECSVSGSQSQKCIDSCRKLVPNGCDCFGCCAVPGAPTPIRLAPTCTAADFNDPAKCPPCTQVTQCMVPCGRCEVCVGKPTIPADCNTYDGGVPDGGTPYTCPVGYMACGQYGVDPSLCPDGTGCVTGCCRPLVP
jgi:hypothetical protein